MKFNACWQLSTFSKCLNEQMLIQGNLIHIINMNQFHLISDNLNKVHSLIKHCSWVLFDRIKVPGLSLRYLNVVIQISHLYIYMYFQLEKNAIFLQSCTLQTLYTIVKFLLLLIDGKSILFATYNFISQLTRNKLVLRN